MLEETEHTVKKAAVIKYSIIIKLLVASVFHIFRLLLCRTQDEDWGNEKKTQMPNLS